MIDAFMVGAITSLVISGFYFLFKKPTKKIHAYIKIIILAVLGIFGLILNVVSLTEIEESPAIIFSIIVSIPLEFVIVYKFIKILKLLQSNEFEE